MKASFRLALLEDIEDIINLCNEVFEENTDVMVARELFEKQNDQNQIYLVGRVDGKIVAHAKITIIPTIYEEMSTYAILNHVCVKKEYRRHNIATDMLKECEKICREKGCVAMELWSKNFRKPAHSCYKKYGFEIMDAAFFSKDLR